MYVLTQRLNIRMPSVPRLKLWLGLGLALALSARTGLAQDDLTPLLPRPEVFRAQYGPPGGEPRMEPDSMNATPSQPQTEFGDVVQDGLLFGDTLSGRTGEAYGALIRAGVFTGPAVGRTDTIVPVELMPYGFINNAMIFGSLRAFRASTDGWGMNLGGGLRYYSERWDRIWGGNIYYDYDNSSGGLFRQTGLGLESLGKLWDMRANAYLPHSVQDRLLKTELVQGSQRFVDHNLLYDNVQTFGNALRGVDWELGLPVPGRVPQRHDLRVFGGAYYYDGTTTKAFTGWKIRAQANVVQNLNVQLEVLDDKVFNTSVVFGATWTYGGYRQPEDQKRTQFDRMTEMVRRNYNVVVSQIPVLDAGKIAINPVTNAPYFFEHVASYAPVPGANGTVDHPWQTITEAQTALNAIIPNPVNQRGNIIYVHANSVYNTAPDNTVTLIPGVRILGEGNGVQHVLNVPNLGPILLPRATNFANRPLFSGQTGNAVTLISGVSNAPSEFSGFQIGDPTDPTSGPGGIGMFGDGIGNVVANQDTINFARGDGVFLNNMSGPVKMQGTVINNVGNTDTSIDSLHIVGGASQFQFGAEPVTLKRSAINNTGGYALLVTDTAQGSNINLTGSDINDGTSLNGNVPAQKGGGILLNNIDGLVTIDNATIVNTQNTGIAGQPTGIGIDIEGHAAPAVHGLGNIAFVGGIAIDNSAGDGIHIEGLQTSSTTTPNLVSNVFFRLPNPVNGVNAPGIRITNRNAAGISVLNNLGNVFFFELVTISGGAANSAILYQNNAGNLTFRSILPSSSPNEILINGGAGNGIQIGGLTPDPLNPNLFLSSQSNTGAFNVVGTTSIQNVNGTSILVGISNFTLPSLPAIAVPPALQVPQTADLWGTTQSANGFVTANHGTVDFGSVSIANRGGRGIAIAEVDNAVRFAGTTQIDNLTNSLLSAIDIQGNFISALTPQRFAGNVNFNTVNITNAQGSVIAPIVSGAGMNVVNNPASVTVQELNIAVAIAGTGLFVQDSGVVDRISVGANQLVTPPVLNGPSIVPSITSASALPSLGLSIGGGTISSIGGPAVNITDAVINVKLDSVSSTTSIAEGINVQNNVGVDSQVKTTGQTIFSTIFSVAGGTIQGSANEGVLAVNTEGVNLSNMNINGNLKSGVYAQTPSLIMNNDQITANSWYGINVDAYAVPRTTANRTLPAISPVFILQHSTVANNLAVQEVLFTAESVGNYTVVLGSNTGIPNTITHPMLLLVPPLVPPETRTPAPANDGAVMIQTAQAAIGATLNLTAINNVLNVTNPVPLALPVADLSVFWNGPVTTGTIQGNTLNFGADQGEGIILNLPSTTATSNFKILSNTFNANTGSATTGIDVTTGGGISNIEITNNLMSFISPNVILVGGARIDSEAMRFNLGARSNLRISTNNITMTGLDVEGMQFTTVAGPSTATINNNLLNLTGGPLTTYGIRILSVTTGTFQLFGNQDNVIDINNATGSTLPWWFSPGPAAGITPGTSGSILVNGVSVQ